MRLLVFTCVLCAAVVSRAETLGQCPSTPPTPVSKHQLPPQHPMAPPSPELQIAGRVVVSAVISNLGTVCSAGVVAGFDKGIDKQAVKAVKNWRFSPASHDGKPVSAFVEVEIAVWRRPDGSFQIDQKQPKQAESPASRDSAPALK